MTSLSNQSKYTVEIVDDHLRIRIRSGLKVSTEDRDLIRMLLSSYLRSEAIDDRPKPGEEVQRRNSKRRHTLDPIVNFFTAYRRKRKMSIKSVAALFGETGSTVSGYENGRSRVYLERLRDWGYALGFDLLPVPIGIRSKVIALVNEYIEAQYQKDLAYWAEEPDATSSYREKVNSNADLSSGSEFLRDGDHPGSSATRQAAS